MTIDPDKLEAALESLHDRAQKGCCYGREVDIEATEEAADNYYLLRAHLAQIRGGGEDKDLENKFRLRTHLALGDFLAKTRYATVQDAQKAAVDFLINYFRVGDCRGFFVRAMPQPPAEKE